MIILLIPLAFGIWVMVDASKRGMNAPLWGILTILLLVIGLPLYLSERKKNPVREVASNLSKSELNQNLFIPEMCPHCKNPNAKRIRLCEWCGSQIC